IHKLNIKRVSMKKLTFVLLCLVLGIGLASAQTTQVTGTVISAEDGEPVIGASVVVKGTANGTVTDYNGEFRLSVPSSAKTTPEPSACSR
ncbi:MAG: carboxypeptidase-like regulatory domain-containing protein, partial [Parabacteroides sp.]|nr:carboxypeptidase-like regulatory domain-containing protein [Parabacteroides sp.]